MFNPSFYDADDPMSMLPPSLRQRLASHRLVFDEYYRCYPIAMLPGPEREDANHGGKVFMPPSALDKLTRLHITYPMLFELINGAKERTTHAGVLEFIAEEGKIYLPFWVMQTLLLEPGDLLQIKSTDLPSGSFIKLQPQSTAFLDISDPKAVLENVMRNFACLTAGDIFSFAYNDQTYEMAVLETKPTTEKKAISVLETDLEVDFAPPVGYVDPSSSSSLLSASAQQQQQRQRGGTSGTNTPGNSTLPGLRGGTIHHQGTMAQAINYSAIAPASASAGTGTGTNLSANAENSSSSSRTTSSSHFTTAGQKLSSATKKGKKASVPPSTSSTPPPPPPPPPAPQTQQQPRRSNAGPQPLRLPPGKLFFGYEIKPVVVRGDDKDKENQDGSTTAEGQRIGFQGAGQTLRAGAKRKGGDGGEEVVKEDGNGNGKGKDNSNGGSDNSTTNNNRPFGGTTGTGRTLRDSK